MSKPEPKIRFTFLFLLLVIALGVILSIAYGIDSEAMDIFTASSLPLSLIAAGLGLWLDYRQYSRALDRWRRPR